MMGGDRKWAALIALGIFGAGCGGRIDDGAELGADGNVSASGGKNDRDPSSGGRGASMDDAGEGARASGGVTGGDDSASPPSGGVGTAGGGRGGEGVGASPSDAPLINAPTECSSPPCDSSPFTIGPFCDGVPRFALLLASEADFISDFAGAEAYPLSMSIPAFERPRSEGEDPPRPIPLEARIDPSNAGDVNGTAVTIFSFPVVLTGTLPTLNYWDLPDYFEFVDDPGGAYYFGYVFLNDRTGNLVWSDVLRIVPNAACPDP